MRRSDRMLLSAVLTSVLSFAGASAASAASPCSMGNSSVAELSEFGAQFVSICLVNEQRARAGAQPLTYNAKLFLAGYGHAADMDEHHFFAHTSPDGSSVATRVAAHSYALHGAETLLGEDLAWGSGAMATPAATVRAWLASPTHRDTMLDPDFREIGIGVRLGAPVAGVVTGESATYAAVFGVIRTSAATKRAHARTRRARARTRARAAACRKAARNHQRTSARCSRMR